MIKTESQIAPCPLHPESEMYSATKRCVACTLEDAGVMPWEIMTQKEAIEKGHRKYWTGKVCINGHVKQRYTVSGICIGCNAMNSAKRVKKARVELSARYQGLESVTVTVHPEDAQAVRDTAEALTTLRGL